MGREDPSQPLRDPSCLSQLLGALLHGCCSHLTYLNLARNSCSHRWEYEGCREGRGKWWVSLSHADPSGLRRKGREAPPAFKQFFSSAYTLSHVNLSATKLPLEALRSGGCRVGGACKGEP